MDLNHYRLMFQNQMIPSRHGDPNTDDTRQWSHDVISGDMRWQQPYRIGFAEDYNIQHPLHNQMHPAMGSAAVQPGYRPMHSIQRLPLEHSRAITPYQRPVGPGSMYQYSVGGYSHVQSPVLRQLHPSNNQLRSLPEVQPGMQMHRELQFDAPVTRIEPLRMQVVPRTIPASPCRPTANRTLELPKTPSAFSMSSTNLPAKRPNMENFTATASPNKRFANLKDLPSRVTDRRRIEGKPNIQVNSPEKEKKITSGVRFVTATVSDVLRWRKTHAFSDLERCNLVVEIVGTVFDISGLKPVKISVHSQSLINGVFWETDLRLDRNAILPGCLVKVVLRITQDGKDFHFLKVTPLKDPNTAENAYRRIAYVTGSSIQQSKKK